MTAYCPAIHESSFWSAGIQAETGSSLEAESIQRNVEESLEHYLRPRLEQLIFPILDIFASAQQGTAVSAGTATNAIAFARLLPRIGPIPEVSVDPDGEISFDWIAPSGSMFSVSVSQMGRLSYAGWFGDDSRIHGTEKLATGIPDEIVRGIQKASR